MGVNSSKTVTQIEGEVHYNLGKEFQQYVTREAASAAVFVYLQVCEVKRYYQVEYNYHEDIDKIVISGSKTKNGPVAAFITVAVYEKLNFIKIQNFIKSNPNRIVYLVIIHPDSTSVYYKITEGLFEPEDAPDKQSKNNKQKQLDMVLRKHQAEIEEAAFNLKPVNIPKSEIGNIESTASASHQKNL